MDVKANLVSERLHMQSSIPGIDPYSGTTLTNFLNVLKQTHIHSFGAARCSILVPGTAELSVPVCLVVFPL